MGAGTIIILMAITFVISWYAAWGLGRYWTESRIAGFWIRGAVIGGVILAALGFTWVYFTILTALAVSSGFVKPEQAQLMYSLGIPTVVGQVAGSGSAIGIHSRILAYRRRTLGVSGIEGYSANPNAIGIWRAAGRATDVLGTIFDTIGYGRFSRSSSAISFRPHHSSGFFPDFKLSGGGSGGKGPGGGRGGGDADIGDGLAILVLVMLAILAIAGGMITTALIVRHADRVHASDIAAAFEPPTA